MKEYLKLNMRIYWTDFIVSLSIFIASFCIMYTTGNILAFLVACIFLYRTCAFTHEIAHQYRNPKIQTFKRIWNWTAGFLMLQPALRFCKPHIMHHTSGIFATEHDPQYPLIFSNWKLAAGIFVVFPWALPIYNLLLCLGVPIEDIVFKNVDLSAGERRHIRRIEVMYVWMWVVVLLINPHVIVPFYLVSVGAWFLSVLRIPLEHSLRSYKKTSTMEDQRLDSFTHENPVYIIVQPLALRYHTVHHLYPKVPYHNLAKLHYDPAASP